MVKFTKVTVAHQSTNNIPGIKVLTWV